MAEQKPDNVVLMNTSAKSFHTSVGELKAGGGVLEIPRKEAAPLMDYRGIIEASKFIPQKNTQALESENTTLKARVKELEEELEKLKEGKKK